MSTVLLLAVLAGWIAVGFWWFVSHRSGPSIAIGSFHRQLGTLERRSGARPPVGRPVASRAVRPVGVRRSTVQKRRRDVVTALGLTTVACLALGFVPALRLLWAAGLASGALLAAYCYLLVQLRTAAAEREMRERFRADRPSLRADGALYSLAGARRPSSAVLTDDAYAPAYGYEPALLRRSAS